MATKNQDTENESFAEQSALTDLLGNHPKVKIITVLLSEGRDINVSQIAEQAGMSRSTVYDHLEDLCDLGVVIQTRKLGGSPLYEIDRENPISKDLGQLEWDLLEAVSQK